MYSIILKLKTFAFVSFVFIAFSCNNSSKHIDYKNKDSHTFAMDSSNFLLDGKAFQIISGELHYSRIPKEYWRQRIQMVKAMGCNAIATYVFWSFHEPEKGQFDFTSGNRNLKLFIQIAQEEGMLVLFRPGPYSCGEWDLGGIPPYLLSIPDIKLRCMDKRYFNAVSRYVSEVSKIVKPLLITNGGPIILFQVENEYGSYGNDTAYINALKNLWVENGINVPFYTADGATPYMLEAGTISGCAVGLDPCVNKENIDLAKKMNHGVPVFSSETYPGWLTHWGKKWSKPDTATLMKQVRFLMKNKISVNFYMMHGGTNFGFNAGANSGGKGYEPDVTSYDFDAPINEQGRATYKYYLLKNEISKFNHSFDTSIQMPLPIPVMEIPQISMKEYSSVWNNLPIPINSVQPKPFEYYNLFHGFAVYKTTLIGRKSGKLKITDLHDYATVFLDGKYIGFISRLKAESSIDLPKTQSKNPVLEIFVEAMGHINFSQEIIDRKGITERVSLNGMTLMNWEVYCLPMDTDYIGNIRKSDCDKERPGKFFKGNFELNELADTYIDMSQYTKGFVWVNNHNLGRYWNIGPQYRLYCPASFLKKGQNEILVFDLLQLESKPIRGVKNL